MELLNITFELFMKNMDFGNAEKCLLKMLEIKNDDPEIFSKLGLLHTIKSYQLEPNERENEINTSVKYFRKALDIDDKHINSLNGLARIYTINGEHEKAIEYYKKSLEIKEDTITRYKLKLIMPKTI